MRSIVYHPSENEYISLSDEYIIKSQENTRWRVMRYKGGFPPLMICTALRAAMIYQVCDLDKKILQKMYPFLQYFLVEPTGIEPVSKNLLI